MADLDKPDLDLVSVLTEYKGRALTALIDRLNDIYHYHQVAQQLLFFPLLDPIKITNNSYRQHR